MRTVDALTKQVAILTKAVETPPDSLKLSLDLIIEQQAAQKKTMEIIAEALAKKDGQTTAELEEELAAWPIKSLEELDAITGKMATDSAYNLKLVCISLKND